MKHQHALSIALLAFLALVIGCNSMQTSSAILRYQQGEFEMADSLCGEALKVNPDDGEAYFYKALSQSMLQNYADAYQSFKKAAELKPSRAEMAQSNIESNFAQAFNDGIEAVSAENNELAIELFRTATGANPENPLGYSNLARAYWTKADRLSELPGAREEYLEVSGLAIDNFQIALEKESDGVKKEETARQMAIVLGNLYVRNDKDIREPFLTEYREFTRELPNLYSPHEAFATVLLNKGEELRELKRKVDLYHDFYVYAGEAFGKADDLRHGLGEDDVQIPLNAGTAYLNAEMYQEGAQYLTRAVNLDPNMENAWFYLEFCHYKAEAYDEAIKAGRFLEQTIGSTDPQIFQIMFQCFKAKAEASDNAGDSAGFEENKTLYEDAYISFATYKGLPDTAPPALLSNKEKEKLAEVEAAIFEKDDIAILRASIEGRFIKGVALNKSDEEWEFVEIMIDLTDGEGETVGSTSAEIENMAPGTETNFSAAFIESDVIGFEISDLLVE